MDGPPQLFLDSSHTPIPNLPCYTVSQLSSALKKALEEKFGYICLRGEISGFRGTQASGHAYFKLKDAESLVDAVVWRGVLNKLSVMPEDGLDVIVTGKVTLYPKRSSYQLTIETMKIAGAGALMALLEKRKKMLAAEGLFDSARKKPLPFLPEVIGVITSPTGAVIRDIHHRISERFPCRIIVWPVRVQGACAAKEISAAIRGFNTLPEIGGIIPRPDVLIVARGGGSLEDLWSFNEEEVVRAAAESRIPLIAAVGHETDWTLIDHAADLRAPTPTAAAEKAVPVREDLIARIQDLGDRQKRAFQRLHLSRCQDFQKIVLRLPPADKILSIRAERLSLTAARLPHALHVFLRVRRLQARGIFKGVTPQLVQTLLVFRRNRLALNYARSRQAGQMILQKARHRLERRELHLSLHPILRLSQGLEQKLTQSTVRMVQIVAAQMTARRGRLEAQAKVLLAVSYKASLRRGFCVVWDKEGQILSKVSEIAPGQFLSLEMAEGVVQARAEGSGETASRTVGTSSGSPRSRRYRKNSSHSEHPGPSEVSPEEKQQLSLF